MGFYGKITNNNATQFIIDKIYPTRADMEDALTKPENDGVLIGRYVLIEYDQKFILRLYKTTKNKVVQFYFSRLLNEESRAKFLTEDEYESNYNSLYGDKSYYNDYYVRNGDVIYTLDENLEQEFYICNNNQSDSGAYATFTPIEKPVNGGSYFDNYRIDMQRYGDSRGFDSTVWQKIYVDGKEKYVMIAELNSVVPTFDLTVDAPTHEPVVPHFDADSTNVYYKLHVQPSWGFKIKDASEQPGESDGNSYPSDTNINYTEQVYNPDKKAYEEEPMNYEAAIYFNKEGFFPETKVTSQSEQIYNANSKQYEEVQNEITLKPTGKSQQAYNVHSKEDPTKKEIVEDTQELVMMLPGIGDAISTLWDIIYNDPGEGNDRNPDIEWGSYGGVRMVTTTNDGYFYEPEKTQTLAGAINSVHDLMGMIVDNQYKDLQEVPLDNVDTNKIYYYNNKFFIKERGYEWVEAKSGVSPYKEILLADAYNPNAYYLKNLNKDYELSTAVEVREGVTYYKLTDIEKIGLDPAYIADKYYYLDGNDYKKDTGSSYDKNKTYFKDLVEKRVTGADNKYFFVAQKHTEVSPGRFKGLFYYNDKNIEIPCDETSIIAFSKIKDAKPFIGTYTKIEEWSPSENKIVTTYNFEAKLSITLVEYVTTTKYYKKNNNNYIYLTAIPNDYYKSNSSYYTITSITQIKNFYEANKYYYLTPTDQKNYRWSSGSYNDDYTYYTLKALGPYQYFYEPNKYYYNNGTDYILDSALNITKNRKYYRYSDLYVHPNNKNTNFIAGALWNTKLDKNDFSNLILGYKYDDWQWKELKGFARTINTLHGLIIETNNILKAGDILTRDAQTVQGCINKINDIINIIETLTPGYFMAVNEYGKITSMQPQGDSWISVTVNNNNNDKVIITHKNPVSTTARNESNKTPNFGETFTIEDWVFDNKGHKANVSTHTIKIPQGSLTAATSNGSDVVTQLEFTPSTGAMETARENIANLKLAGYTKKNDNGNIASSDTLGVALSKLQTQIIEEETARADAIKTLDVAANESTTHFISKISQTDGKIAVERAAAGTLQLLDANGNYSVPNTASAIVKTDSIVTAFGKVEAQIKAEETIRAEKDQEFTSKLSEEITKRENAIEQEVKDRNAAIKTEVDKLIAIKNALDATITTENSEVITSITQTDGLVSAGKKKIGEIALTGWTLGENVNDTSPIADTDTVFNAFAKTQRQINANKVALAVLNGNSSTPGSVAYQIAQIVTSDGGAIDKLEEIAAWIVSDTTGAAKMNSDIKANTDAIDALELLVGNTDVATQIADAINNALIVNGGNKYALAADLVNLSTTVSNINSRVEDLELAVSAEKIAQWDAAVSKEEYETKVAELEQEDYTLNSRCNVLDQEVKNLINKSSDFVTLKNYEAKIAELEQANYTLNSRCNVLDKEVKNLINIVAEFETRIIELEAKLQ